MKRLAFWVAVMVATAAMPLFAGCSQPTGIDLVNKAADNLRRAGSARIKATLTSDTTRALRAYGQDFVIDLSFCEKADRIQYLADFATGDQQYRQYSDGNETYVSIQDQPWHLVEGMELPSRQNLPMPLAAFFYGIQDEDRVENVTTTQKGADTEVAITAKGGAVQVPYGEITDGQPTEVTAIYVIGPDKQFKEVYIISRSRVSYDGANTAIRFKLSAAVSDLGAYSSLEPEDRDNIGAAVGDSAGSANVGKSNTSLVTIGQGSQNV